MSGKRYTEEEIQWLSEQDPSLTYEELADGFSKRFRKVSKGQMSDVRRRYPDRMPDRRGNNKKTQFQIGKKPKYPVGAEITKAGYVWVKVSDEYIPGTTTNADYRRIWRRKSDLIWEKENGKLPEGTFLIFLDGNTLNCDIDNLYPVTRSIHVVMTKNHWYKKNKDFTLATLKYCELLQTIKGEK